ncbi:MAG: hypothetical protein LBS70_09810 [Candidatus Accumulibacter sp.]|jgi:hypothetical protein|nr:hypothetical protein [Accumulibacter sp.]
MIVLRDKARPLAGRFCIEVRRHGVLVDFIDEWNLIVDGAKNQLARLVGGTGQNRHIDRIGFGIGTTAASPSDTALTSPYLKPVGSVDYPASGEARFNWSLSTTELNGVAITEFGLFCVDGTLFSRKSRAPIEKDADLTLAGSWTIIF